MAAVRIVVRTGGKNVCQGRERKTPEIEKGQETSVRKGLRERKRTEMFSDADKRDVTFW